LSFWRHLNNRWEKLIHIDVHYYQIIDTSIDNIRAWCSSSYGSWINNYLCNQCISPLMLWVLIPLMRGVLDTTLCDKVCQWLAASRFSPIIPVSSTNKADYHDISEILLKVLLNTITLTRIYTVGCSIDNGILLALCNFDTWIHPRFLVGFVLLNR
jgi:hypothetical protein